MLRLPKVDSTQDLKAALSLMGGLRQSQVAAVEVLWTPQQVSERQDRRTREGFTLGSVREEMKQRELSTPSRDRVSVAEGSERWVSRISWFRTMCVLTDRWCGLCAPRRETRSLRTI